jgi:hypothetical protein
MSALQCLVNDGVNGFDVFTGSDFRKDPAVLGMQIYLAGDRVGMNHATVADDRGSGLITGSLYAKNSNCWESHAFFLTFHFIGRIRSMG